MKFVSRRTSLSGVSFAIAAPVLFAASTSFSKILLKIDPVMPAGTRYLGSGIGSLAFAYLFGNRRISCHIYSFMHS